jgi:hypothetical protein
MYMPTPTKWLVSTDGWYNDEVTTPTRYPSKNDLLIVLGSDDELHTVQLSHDNLYKELELTMGYSHYTFKLKE